MQFLEKILQLTEEGIDEDREDIIGFHGTSIEAIAYLSKHGRLPVSGKEVDDFYFCPKDDPEAQEWAADYANINGICWAVYKLLLERGFVLEDKLRYKFFSMWEFPVSIVGGSILINDHDSFPDGDSRDIIASLKEQSIISRSEFSRICQSLVNIRKGVSLAISSAVNDLHPVDHGEGAGRSITVPTGLSIDYIVGIEPHSQFEWDELTKNRLANVPIIEV
jgi:hypothetical protein